MWVYKEVEASSKPRMGGWLIGLKPYMKNDNCTGFPCKETKVDPVDTYVCIIIEEFSTEVAVCIWTSEAEDCIDEGITEDNGVIRATYKNGVMVEIIKEYEIDWSWAEVFGLTRNYWGVDDGVAEGIEIGPEDFFKAKICMVPTEGCPTSFWGFI